jgi:hypothetical protein
MQATETERISTGRRNAAANGAPRGAGILVRFSLETEIFQKSYPSAFLAWLSTRGCNRVRLQHLLGVFAGGVGELGAA